MNRTDRLYALVEELRAVAPRPRSARWLAEKFSVSSRTIERDLSALQQSGVPIWAAPGRTGGYCLDPVHTLAPLGLNVDEALAVMISLGMLATSPFHAAATSALRKVVAVMDGGTLRESTDLATRIHLLDERPVAGPPNKAPESIAGVLRTGEVLQITYVDRNGTPTEREVEPMECVGKGSHWYLIGWCRLRDGLRAFRGDRISAAEPTGERPPRRILRPEDLGIVYGELRTVGPDGKQP
ncbi:WYL domain-containing protein [Arthrobacter sp. zg-Y20]|uniref:helix-turn-helix transcriptional regulator n=1 Tax=unclassified Arthrobacter TaxID=235627 RepID=UPI001D1523B1|nr:MULTISPECIES: WYL domain-containing protein [unclassified Arthrobacter]MCC3277407.1 WYL domain-containing protein [Arthrobacter sp. zg-Y20]MDK1317567.1 WYL domain-containing protein [Arthrobacter sp. zg.Y20]WIB06936.1 WYL domain-containing protein [Arthrobacter sp. zg-Y20]